MDIAFSQEIYYSNKNELSLNEVAKALLALEKSAGAVPGVMEGVFSGLVVQDVQLFVDELHSGSLSERIKYCLKIAFQRRIEEESGLDLDTFEKDSSPGQREKIAAWVVAAVILMALKMASEQFFPGAEKTHIEKQINIHIHEGSELTKRDPDFLEEKIRDVLKDNPDVVKAAVEFARPAKKDPDAEIQLNKKTYLSNKALAEVPSALPDVEPTEKSIEYERAEIYIRATDRDSGKKGWGATVPEFSDRRIRLSIAPGIDLGFLAHHDVVIGEVSVFYSVDEKGNVIKPHAHLFSVDIAATKALGGASSGR